MPAHRTLRPGTFRKPQSSVHKNALLHYSPEHAYISRHAHDTRMYSLGHVHFETCSRYSHAGRIPHPAKTISSPPTKRTLGLENPNSANTSHLFCEHDLIDASRISSMIGLTRSPHPSTTTRWITDPARRTGSSNQHAVASGHTNTTPPHRVPWGGGVARAVHSHFVHLSCLKAEFTERNRDVPVHISTY